MNIFPQLKRTPLKRSTKQARTLTELLYEENHPGITLAHVLSSLRRAKRIKRAKPSTLKNKLTKAFNAMIRERDQGLPCISCQAVPGSQAGHFMRCELLATRWHPENVNGQCDYCNCWLHGNRFLYGINLNKKFASDTAERMERLARTTWKPSREALEQLLAAAKLGAEAYQEIWEFYGSEAK